MNVFGVLRLVAGGESWMQAKRVETSTKRVGTARKKVSSLFVFVPMAVPLSSMMYSWPSLAARRVVRVSTLVRNSSDREVGRMEPAYRVRTFQGIDGQQVHSAEGLGALVHPQLVSL